MSHSKYTYLAILLLICIPLSIGATEHKASLSVINDSSDTLMVALWFYSPDSGRWYSFFDNKIGANENQVLMDHYPTGRYIVRWDKSRCIDDCVVSWYHFEIEDDTTNVLLGVESAIYDRNG